MTLRLLTDVPNIDLNIEYHCYLGYIKLLALKLRRLKSNIFNDTFYMEIHKQRYEH